MRNLKGSNQYKTKFRYRFWPSIWFLTALWFAIALYGYATKDSRIISPCPKNGCNGYNMVYAERPDDEKIDLWVNDYSEKYAKSNWHRNRIRAMIHYLLLREQNYGGSNACGDSGKSCGPLQFREATYIANSKRMMKLGLRDHLGSRFDMEDSIDVCAYMISIGQEKQWGPIARGEIKI